MSPSLSKVNRAVEDAPTVSRTHRKGRTLHVYMRDVPREYEVRVKDGGIEVIEIDTTGGGRIGGVRFDDEDEAAAHIRSI